MVPAFLHVKYHKVHHPKNIYETKNNTLKAKLTLELNNPYEFETSTLSLEIFQRKIRKFSDGFFLFVVSKHT